MQRDTSGHRRMHNGAEHARGPHYAIEKRPAGSQIWQVLSCMPPRISSQSTVAYVYSNLVQPHTTKKWLSATRQVIVALRSITHAQTMVHALCGWTLSVALLHAG